MDCRWFSHILLSAALFVANSVAFAEEPNALALALVRQTGLNENLATLSYQYGRQTTAYRIIAKTIGEEKAQSLLMNEISKARPKYQGEWDRNLAASYADVFSEGELRSLVEEGASSPYKRKLFDRQRDVGNRMQARSTHLLQCLPAEVLANAYAEAVPKK